MKIKNLSARVCLTLLIIGTMFVSSVSFAQSKAELEVVEAVEFMRVAMISGNRADLEKIAAEKLSYGHSSGALDDKNQFVEKIASGQSDFITIELKNQTVSVSGKTALVRHDLHAEINDNNKPGVINLKVLLIFQKQKGGWKLLARQAVKTN